MQRMFLSFVLFFAVGSAVAGEMVTDTLASTALDRDVRIFVYLPTGVDRDGTVNYPVAYFLAGYSSCSRYFDFTDSLEVTIERGGRSMIVVFVSGGGNSFFEDSDSEGNYKTHFLDEVMPFVESNYPVIAERSGRALIGHSNGAAGAARIALLHPEMFSGFVSHAGVASLYKLASVIAPLVRSEAGLLTFPEPDMGPWCDFMYSLSRIFSPNPSAEYGCDPIVGSFGEIQEEVWEVWKPHDPYTLIEQAGDAMGLSVYLDCGADDMWKPVTVHLENLLVSLNIDHYYKVYSGDHPDIYLQYGVASAFLSDMFDAALGTPELCQAGLPDSPILLSACPNPFNSSTRVRLELRKSADVRLTLFNLLGRPVLRLHQGITQAGRQEMVLDGSELASGTYFLNAVTSTGEVTNRRIVLLR